METIIASYKTLNTLQEQRNKIAKATATQLAEILGGASRVATLVDEIAAASKEQAQGIEQINTRPGAD